MSSILTILFVAAMTLLCKWLLLDSDQPQEAAEPVPPLQIADTPPETPSNPFSKTA